MSFTPGPWDFGAKEGPREVTLKRRHYVVGRNGGKGVAIAFGNDDSNARLIAAAPDLLQSLKEFIADFEIVARNSYSRWNYATGKCDDFKDEYLKIEDPKGYAMWQAAKAAIQKAEPK